MTFEIAQVFAEKLKKVFSLHGSASPEDQLKAPIASLIAEIGKAKSLDISSQTEAQIAEHKVRPVIERFAECQECGEPISLGSADDQTKISRLETALAFLALAGVGALLFVAMWGMTP